MQKCKMIDEVQEMKKIYEIMIFEDTKYEPNITNNETNVLDCGEFDDGSNSRTSCINESICHNETDNEYDN